MDDSLLARFEVVFYSNVLIYFFETAEVDFLRHIIRTLQTGFISFWAGQSR